MSKGNPQVPATNDKPFVSVNIDYAKIDAASAGLKKMLASLASPFKSVLAPVGERWTAHHHGKAIDTYADTLRRNGDIPLQIVMNGGTLSLSANTDVDTQTTLAGRGMERKQIELSRKQNNLEKVLAVTADELAEDDAVSEVPVDEDWMARFMGYAEDVSSEMMQDIWGRILRGEIKQPGSFGLRTIDFVRSMSQEEAIMLSNVGKRAFTSDGETLLLQRQRGFQDHDEIQLAEIGLIQEHFRTYRIPCSNEMHWIEAGSKVLSYHSATPVSINLDVSRFTKVGSELVRFVQRTDEESETVLRNVAQLLATPMTMALGMGFIEKYTDDGAIIHVEQVLKQPGKVADFN